MAWSIKVCLFDASMCAPKKSSKTLCGNLDTSLSCFAAQSIQWIVFWNNKDLFERINITLSLRSLSGITFFCFMCLLFLFFLFLIFTFFKKNLWVIISCSLRSNPSTVVLFGITSLWPWLFLSLWRKIQQEQNINV